MGLSFSALSCFSRLIFLLERGEACLYIHLLILSLVLLFLFRMRQDSPVSGERKVG